MSGGGRGGWVVVQQPPESSPALRGLERGDQQWTSSLDDSVNAVSFGFVATAILISMFLLMAIFEKFLRARSAATQPPIDRNRVIDFESRPRNYDGELELPSPKAIGYAMEVSVVMPGDEIPTFIAHPAPPPCPPEPTSWHHQASLSCPPRSRAR